MLTLAKPSLRMATATVWWNYNGWTVLETTDGHIWELENAITPTGKTVWVVFETSGTDYVEDDVIISVR